MRRIDEIETTLDPFNTHFKPVNPTLNADDAFFQAGHADFQVLNVFSQPIDLLVDTPEIDQHDVVGFIGHHRHSAAISRTGSECGLAE
jgi:hypothetical protein